MWEDFHFLFFWTPGHQLWSFELSFALVRTFYLNLFWRAVVDNLKTPNPVLSLMRKTKQKNIRKWADFSLACACHREMAFSGVTPCIFFSVTLWWQWQLWNNVVKHMKFNVLIACNILHALDSQGNVLERLFICRAKPTAYLVISLGQNFCFHCFHCFHLFLSFLVLLPHSELCKFYLWFLLVS